jgi:hypothetical protein
MGDYIGQLFRAPRRWGTEMTTKKNNSDRNGGGVTKNLAQGTRNPRSHDLFAVFSDAVSSQISAIN